MELNATSHFTLYLYFILVPFSYKCQHSMCVFRIKYSFLFSGVQHSHHERARANTYSQIGSLFSLDPRCRQVRADLHGIQINNSNRNILRPLLCGYDL